MSRVLAFAADTLVRFRNGRVLVHTTTSGLPAFETDQPMLIRWICRFAVPTDADAAITALPPADRTGAEHVVDYLTRNHLRLLARSVYDLACGVLGLGQQRTCNCTSAAAPGFLPGWINIDVCPAPMSMNVLWGLPFRDHSASRVFVSHLVEHLLLPTRRQVPLWRVETGGGAGPEPAHHFEAHKDGYDFETLAKVLGQAGFERER